jgi:hypothetical protein
MSRSHFRPRRRPPRRGAHPDDSCVLMYPPGADTDVYVGICESLQVWRIKADPFDACGPLGPDGNLDTFFDALGEAVDRLRYERPELAQSFEALLQSREAD